MKFAVLFISLIFSLTSFSMNKKEMAEKLANDHNISFQMAIKAIDTYENFVVTSLRGGFAVASEDGAFVNITPELRKRIPQHSPDWTDHNDSDPGRAGNHIVLIPATNHLKSFYKELMKNYLDKATPMLVNSLASRGVRVPRSRLITKLNYHLKNEVLNIQDGGVLNRKRPGRAKYADITLKRGPVATEKLGKEMNLDGDQQRLLNSQMNGALGAFFQAVEANLRLDEFSKKVKTKGVRDLASLLMFLPDATPLRVAQDLMFKLQMRALSLGERVMQPKFGTFSLDFEIRKIKNKIEAKTYPIFKPAPGLKDRVRD